VRRKHSGRSIATPAASGHGRNTRAPSQSLSLPETKQKRQGVRRSTFPARRKGGALTPLQAAPLRKSANCPFIHSSGGVPAVLGTGSTPPFRRAAARFPTASEFFALLLPSENTCHSSLPDCLPPMINAGWTANCAAKSMVDRSRSRTARTSSALNPPLALPPSGTTP